MGLWLKTISLDNEWREFTIFDIWKAPQQHIKFSLSTTPFPTKISYNVYSSGDRAQMLTGLCVALTVLWHPCRFWYRGAIISTAASGWLLTGKKDSGSLCNTSLSFTSLKKQKDKRESWQTLRLLVKLHSWFKDQTNHGALKPIDALYMKFAPGMRAWVCREESDFVYMPNTDSPDMCDKI